MVLHARHSFDYLTTSHLGICFDNFNFPEQSFDFLCSPLGAQCVRLNLLHSTFEAQLYVTADGAPLLTGFLVWILLELS